MAVTPIVAPELAARHGFFTRENGASGGVYTSLNCGAGSDDLPEHVVQNRARVAQYFGLDAQRLASLHQHHSADVRVVDGPPDPHGPRPKGDALVARADAGVALGILTADCAPILFHDQAAGVIGAAHAGWRGALGGVIEATIAAMCALGSRAEGISAVVGPCISQAHYEVGPEFIEAFLVEDPRFARFFVPGEGDRLRFDLPGFCLMKLRAAGADASWIGACTYADPARFYSYRRATHHGEADYGRLISVIAPDG